MHNRLLNVMAALLLTGAAAGPLATRICAADASSPERMKNLEQLMELAVDRFQLNRFIEARAALNRLQAESPSDEEAFALRKLFGERILLEMQKYGDRPQLKPAERQALALLGEAVFALDMTNAEKAADRIKAVKEAFVKSGFSAESFEVARADAIAQDIAALKADQPEEFRKVSARVQAWKEELQSVGNTPLVLLTRAQRYEQSQLRSPEMIARIVGAAVLSQENAQRHMLEIDRLGSYAVPELIRYLRNNKSDSTATNAHFILLTLGQQVTIPLCEALKTKDQLLLQQLSSILGDMQPRDQRAVAYLKAVYDNKDNLASTRDTAAVALENITGQKADALLPAAYYFLALANHYYLGGPAVDREALDMNRTLWVWDPAAEGGKGALQQAPAPAFILCDLLAEEAAYRGMELAASKVPFQVMLASIFMQQKNKADTIAKLLFRENMSLPDAEKVRKEANEWRDRLNRNMRVAYALGADYLSAVLEKAMIDQKVEVAVSALDALTLVSGKDGWAALKKFPRVASGLDLTSRVQTSLDSAKPAAAGKGVSGDGAVAPAAAAPIAPAASVPVVPAVAPAISGTAADALIAALGSKSDRIAIAAANCLARIGLPASDASYAKLLPLLIKGAEENRATVALVVSRSATLRDRLAGMLEKDQVVPMVSAEGYAAYQMATQYPPKDAILIDNSIDQFDMLRLQMELRNISHGKVLPLTIITTRDHAANIAEQFSKETIEAEARAKHTDAASIVNAGSGMYEGKPWRVVVRHNINADSKGIYEDISGLARYGSDFLSVVVLTNPTREGREQLKKALMLRAERELRPEGLTEYARLKNQEKVLGDIFGVRATYVPVFLDEEIGGYDAMTTVQALQTDPRTRAVPIAILTDADRLKDVEKDFEFFIKDGKVRILTRDVDNKALAENVTQMREANDLSKQNYARALSNNIALRSAQALDSLDTAALGQGLTPDQQREVLSIVTDVNRPEDLRIAAAEVLGHFKAGVTVKKLMTLFADTDVKQVKLRAAILRAVGQIDVKNEQIDFKLQAMNDPEVEIQEEAAKALGPAAQGSEDVRRYLNDLRPNDPLTLVKPAAAKAGDGEVKAGEEKKEEAKSEEKAADSGEKKEEKKEEKKSEGGFNW